MNDLRSHEAFPLDLFDDTVRMLRHPWRFEVPDLAPRIRIDVSESDGQYRVQAEMPGVRKEDIEVRIDGSTVTIGAQVQSGHEERDGGRVIRQERREGYASRVFTLAAPVDEKGAEATYRDGILELKLPKRAAASTQRLAIR